MIMFGGDNSNPGFPAFMEENRFQYDANALPQLQLFGDFSAGYGVDPLNYMGNEHITAMSRPLKRGRQAESVSRQQKLQASLKNNFCQDEAGHSGSILNPNPVSTGLKLSYEEDEHNSSVTSASENMTAALPIIFSLSDNLKAEIDRQKQEFDHYIRVQEENIMKGVRELKHRHTAAFLGTLENVVSRKLREKEAEVENINRKNKELVERIKQVTMEVQSWHYRAKYNESVVNALKTNLKQVIAQGAVQGKEGCGDSSEVDDAASYANNLGVFGGGSGNPGCSSSMVMNCKGCKVKEVNMLLLPCRHLCLCMDCEGFVDVCPVCGVMKTASVKVFMS